MCAFTCRRAGNMDFALIPGVFYLYVPFTIGFQIQVRSNPGLPPIPSQANKGEFWKLKLLYKKE